MSKTFHLTVAKVGENLFDGEALSVSLPGVDGRFQVLALHEAMVSELNDGEARIETANGEKISIAIPAGAMCEVSSNQATVLI